MTIPEAKLALARKPVFGDDSQIKANQFLQRVADYLPHFKSCNACQNWEYCDVAICMPFDIQDALFEEYCPEPIKALIIEHRKGPEPTGGVR